MGVNIKEHLCKIQERNNIIVNVISKCNAQWSSVTSATAELNPFYYMGFKISLTDG